jgi:hypothetical protein
MRRIVLRAAVLAIVSAAASGGVAAQATATGGVGVGYTDLSFVLGLGGTGDAGFSLGARFERVFKALPDLGDGHLGIMGSIDWWKYDIGVGTIYDITYIPISGTANYHFNVKSNPKIDPFVGAGLGYWIVNTNFGGSYNSGIYFITRAGIRYFFSPKVAFYGDVGFGASNLNVGLSFALKK